MQKNREDKQQKIARYILCELIIFCIVVIVVSALRMKGESGNMEEVVPTLSIARSTVDASEEELSEEKGGDTDVTPTPVGVPTLTPLQAFNIVELDVGEKEMQVWCDVNVRDYPSKSGKIVGNLECGVLVTVTGRCKETDWYQINYNGTVAYVCDDYIVEIGSDLQSIFNPEEDIENLESSPEITYDRNWTAHEKECLAKLVMAEAEGQTLQVKTLIILTVLNRVQSSSFPNTIEEVILQKGYVGGEVVYQYFYTYYPGGRYHWVTPNEDCWKAVEIAQNLKYDFSNGAMYFENSSDTSWAGRNLELTVEVSGTKFYK